MKAQAFPVPKPANRNMRPSLPQVQAVSSQSLCVPEGCKQQVQSPRVKLPQQQSTPTKFLMNKKLADIGGYYILQYAVPARTPCLLIQSPANELRTQHTTAVRSTQLRGTGRVWGTLGFKPGVARSFAKLQTAQLIIPLAPNNPK